MRNRSHLHDPAPGGAEWAGDASTSSTSSSSARADVAGQYAPRAGAHSGPPATTNTTHRPARGDRSALHSSSQQQHQQHQHQQHQQHWNHRYHSHRDTPLHPPPPHLTPRQYPIPSLSPSPGPTVAAPAAAGGPPSGPASVPQHARAREDDIYDTRDRGHYRAVRAPSLPSMDLEREDERERAYAAAAAAGPSRSRYDYDYDRDRLPMRTETSPQPWASAPPSSTSRHPPAHTLSYPPPSHYPYPYHSYPPHAATHQDGPPPGGATGWSSPWGAPPYGAGYPPPPPSASHAASGVPPGRHAQPAPPAHATPSPPPPASPSQIARPAPPPPASAPSPADTVTSPAAGYLPGFQPDYDRARGGTRRPSAPEAEATGASSSASAGVTPEARPPPTEAYILIRPHRVPRGGWATTPDTQQSSDSAGWTYNLEVLQHPERGKALGVEQLRRGWPPLTPPLIVQLNVLDSDGNPVPTDNSTLARRLVHLTMSVELVSPDGNESRSLIRVRPPSPRGNVQPYYPASAPPPYSVQRTLLGSSVRTAQILTREGRKGLYFIFQDMIVRPEGQYALEGRILDLAGPPHIGTSIGVTHPLASCRTNQFDVIIPQEFPGPVPITPLSAEFLRQGERHLGRRPRTGEDGSDQEDTGAHE